MHLVRHCEIGVLDLSGRTRANAVARKTENARPESTCTYLHEYALESWMCCANMCHNNHVKASSCKGKHTWVCGVVFCHDEICNVHSAVGKEVISVM